MTPAQLDHLSRIKRHLETLLAKAEKRTPGEWEDGNGAVWHDCDNEGQGEVCEFVKTNDASFIASCAGNAEAGWKSTLAAIEVIVNCNENSFPHMYAAVQVAQMADSILNTWPLESLIS